ncbi:hypothetical protein [Fulvimonas yonginensis]|uniref:DUF3887 domain-containing protein n=1 Tax=Fulvimonas yonginensis TaxID=1495200 RepID=A0ABU8JAS5_9GAMM
MLALRSATLAFACILALGAPPAHASDDCAGKVVALADALVHQDFQGATRDMDGFMKMMMSAEHLSELWNATLHDAGAYVSRGDAAIVASDKDAVAVRVPLRFAHGAAALQAVCKRAEQNHIGSVVLQMQPAG